MTGFATLPKIIPLSLTESLSFLTSLGPKVGTKGLLRRVPKARKAR